MSKHINTGHVKKVKKKKTLDDISKEIKALPDVELDVNAIVKARRAKRRLDRR